ncbi:MAG: hypothetical protein N2747_00270 [Chitinophagaceae bacterium]|nr:hypothetical protein [Chitinophagaceae bacterium]
MRAISTKTLINKNISNILTIDDPKLSSAIGEAEAKGIWLIYGPEKNGKTWFALTLAKSLCNHHKVAYISAEEGTDKSLVNALKRASLNGTENIKWYPYIAMNDIRRMMIKRNSPDVVIVDNLTVYIDELRPADMKNLLHSLRDKLIVFIGHEERKEPYPATARMAQKIAKVYVHVKGLQAFVISRFGPGGELIMAEKKGKIFWG